MKFLAALGLAALTLVGCGSPQSNDDGSLKNFAPSFACNFKRSVIQNNVASTYEVILTGKSNGVRVDPASLKLGLYKDGRLMTPNNYPLLASRSQIALVREYTVPAGWGVAQDFEVREPALAYFGKISFQLQSNGSRPGAISFTLGNTGAAAQEVCGRGM